MIDNNVTIQVYHDTRKANKTGKYQVYIRVYYDRVTKFFPVFYQNQRLKLTPEDFKSSYKSKKPKEDHKKYKIALDSLKLKAEKTAGNLDPFTMADFEKYFTGKSKNRKDIVTAYNDIIQDAIDNETLKVKTYRNYQSALKSFLQYFTHIKGRQVTEIEYKEITPALLKSYEKYMLSEIKDGDLVIKKASTPTTVSMYTRTLRTVIINAVETSIIPPELNPFGKGKTKYSPPSQRKRKIALTSEQLQALLNYDTSNDKYLQKAVHFFLFSLAAQGMNIGDVCRLTYSTITGDSFTFYRNKTNSSSNNELTPVTVPITEFIQFIFDTYGNEDKSPDNYIFPILNDTTNELEKVRAIENFIRSINQQLKKLVEPLKIPANFSTYYARHTYATELADKGVSIGVIMRGLGQRKQATTEIYLHYLKGDNLRDINSNLVPLLPIKSGTE